METIASISTAPGIGGIGIVRMSGEKCFEILNNIFMPRSDGKIKGYSIKYGNIINPDNNKIIDEVLVSYFVSPKSYTKEDMCEINAHGSNIILNEILELLLNNGARLAEPGEFTKRAFLNGRIDLSQAESVIDVINAKTEKEKQAAINQLEGFLSENIKKIKNMILNILVNIEVSIDYPEYDTPDVDRNKIYTELDNIKEELIKLENSFSTGKILKDGLSIAIIGRPNAGKSSLLNKILKEERAIVTNVEGTTRDTIEEFININGIPAKIIDTAGIRNAKDEIEKIGIEKAKKIAEKSDLIIAIFDITKRLEEEDFEILKLIENKNAIIILNKIDLCINEEEIPAEILETNKKYLKISAITGDGIEEIYNEISSMFCLDKIKPENNIIITNTRHKQSIKDALKNILKAEETLRLNFPEDIVAINLKDSIECLNSITGENVTDEIINNIFSKFCLGK